MAIWDDGQRLVAFLAVSFIVSAGLPVGAEERMQVRLEKASGESFEPLRTEEVCGAYFPSYYDWRKAALKNNLNVVSKMTATKTAVVVITDAPSPPASEEMFVFEARKAAAAAGANLLCVKPGGRAAEGKMKFDLYRLQFEGKPVPADFIRLLAATSFHDDSYLQSLLEEWIQKTRTVDMNPPPRPSPVVPTLPAAVASPVVPVPPPAKAEDKKEPAASAVSLPLPVEQVPPPAKEKGEKEAPVGKKEGAGSADKKSSSGGEKKEERKGEPGGPLPTILPGSPVPEMSLSKEDLPLPSADPGRTEQGKVAVSTASPEPRPVEEVPGASSSAPVPSAAVPPSDPAARKTEAPRLKAVGAGCLSMLVPGLGQRAAGDKAKAAVVFATQVGLLTGSAMLGDHIKKNVDRGLSDVYWYRVSKYVAAAYWVSQSAATTVRLWPKKEKTPPDVNGALARSFVLPGWGLIYSGYYETGFNVMALEGFVLYWGTKSELPKKERLNLVAFSHWGQVVLTGVLAKYKAAGLRAALVPADDGAGVVFVLQKRFGREE